MRKVVEFVLPAALACFAAFVVTTTGCTPGEEVDCEANPTAEGCSTTTEKCADGPDSCTDCSRKADCEGARADGDNRSFICNGAVGECIHVCTSTSECGQGQVCEELRCRTPACVSDDDCGADQCINGACEKKVAASDVASCTVLPTYALLNVGAAKEFSVSAKNAAGETVPYKGTVSWSGTNVSTANSTNIAAVTAGAAGDVSVAAKVGSVDCKPATGLAFAAVTTGSRVVVADLITGQPVQNATVVVGAEEKKTAANGAVTFDATGTKTVSVFHAAYSFVTVANTDSEDLVVYVKPAIEKVGFKGSKTADDFARLEVLNETIRIALLGSSIPGNLIDISVDTLIGDLVPTHLDFPGLSDAVPLPSGSVIGLGRQMFKTDYSVLATPGVRTVWALGGNLPMSDLMDAVTGALESDDIDVGGVLGTLLPLLGRLQSGAVTGLQTPAPVDGETALASIDVPLNVLLRLNVNAKLPNLPSYQLNGVDQQYEGAVVLAGALYSPEGLVPLGLTVGIDENGDGKVENEFDASKAGVLPLRFAARHSGLETGDFVSLALATSFGGLLGGDEGGDDEDLPLVLSGLVTFLNDFPYAPNATTAPEITLADRWLTASNTVTVDDAGRTVTLDKVDGATFYRLDIGETGKEWSVYFGQPAGDTATVTIPAVPAEFASDDRFAGEADLMIQAVSTGYNPDLDFNKVVSFTGENMNDLTRSIDAFVTRDVR